MKNTLFEMIEIRKKYDFFCLNKLKRRVEVKE